ncbi:unnamed protein product [Calypogeia fissa]
MGVAAYKFSDVLLIAFLLSCTATVSSSRLLPTVDGISTSRVLLGARSGPGSNGGPDTNNNARNGFVSPLPAVAGPIPDPNSWVGHPPVGSIANFPGPFPGPAAGPWVPGFGPRFP